MIAPALQGATLSDGQLKDGSSQLSSGVKKLESGAKTLKDGMAKYKDEGIGKLLDIYNNDLKGLIDRLDALKTAAASASSVNARRRCSRVAYSCRRSLARARAL